MTNLIEKAKAKVKRKRTPKINIVDKYDSKLEKSFIAIEKVNDEKYLLWIIATTEKPVVMGLETLRKLEDAMVLFNYMKEGEIKEARPLINTLQALEAKAEAIQNQIYSAKGIKRQVNRA